MAAYLYEFLYRGVAAGGAFHVILAQDVEVHGTVQTIIDPRGALTPEQAKAEGFDLPDIIEGINTQMLAHNTALTTSLDEHKTAIAIAEEAKQVHAEALDDLRVKHQALENEKHELQAQLAIVS